jgi:glycosyltransferase involved in cell wall biosynthesis
MRVGVHLEALRPGIIGGHEQYVRELIDWMPRLDPQLTMVLYCADYNADTFTASPQLEIHQLTGAEFDRLDAGRLRDDGFDVWFCPLLVLQPEFPGLPSVVNIPDIQHETFPEFFTPELLAWRRETYRKTIERATRILTESEFSRREIIERLGADPERVKVTYLASTLDPAGPTPDLAELRDRLGLPETYIYYPACAWPHKNHRRLFEALAALNRRLARPLDLVLTGGAVEGGVDLEKTARRLGIEDNIHHVGYLAKEDLPGLYAGSLALVFPSLFEGFGLPPVEAMAMGCPVLASTAACLPEICGDAGVFFDPEQPDELCELLFELCEHQSCGGRSRQELIAAGKRRAAEFSWEAAGRSTIAALRSADDDFQRSDELRLSVVELPSISVITPSYNQCEYIERTLDSVLLQDYPRLQYLVTDGGSTDGTVEVLERYRERYPDVLEFVSEKDRGQAHAVNKGFERARGEIIGWLNSDDTYNEDTLRQIAGYFALNPDCDLAYGRADYVDGDDRALHPYPIIEDYNWHTLAHECFFCQPAVFFRRRILDHDLRLDEALQTCMDYDLWIRIGESFEVRFFDRFLANSRIYYDNKTLSQRTLVYDEVYRTVKKHYRFLPLSWALGRAHYRWDGGDPFFDERPLSKLAFLGAGWLMLRHNLAFPRRWPQVAREISAFIRPRLRRRFHLLFGNRP